MRIIGVDPGVAITGWAVVDFEGRQIEKVVDFGVIETHKSLELSERLGEIYTDLCEILEKFKPEFSSVELLIFCNNAKTAIKVGEARGVILLALNKYNVGLYEYTPLQLKNSISGYGKADKKQVQENVRRMCNFEEIPKPDDAADAIALAICCNDSIILNDLSKLNEGKK
jgi:crossover junction endodeoxyribonuclease RuvC